VFFAGKAAATIRAYRLDLADLARFLGLPGPEDAAARILKGGPARAQEVGRLWQARLLERSAPATVNRRLAALTGLVRTARAMGLADWPLSIRPVQAERQKEIEGPGRPAIRQMLALARATPSPQGPRDVCVLLLLYGCGLRRGELLGLDLDHVDLARDAIAIHGKGRHERRWLKVPLAVKDALTLWLVVRGDEPGPLITATRGQDRRLSPAGLYRVVRSLGLRAGVKTSPHGLRHTAITDAIRSGRNVADVQRFSRHADMRTLRAYYDAALGVPTEIAEDLVRGL
jgi:integrase/recombinase XerC